ncbi:MAG: hypothetical protein JSW40_02935 [Candidatus Omnitrophota bacterium]|nr:MAG: hypothetical protein JSW40_02935 [Candidatus Omnitrophota bacterium]
MKIAEVLMCCVVFAISGCTIATKYNELLTLKRLANSRGEIARYLERQEELFDKLREDVENNKLQEGITKRRAISLYGDPVLSKDAPHLPQIAEILLYRHPTEYFSSDKIYLYFDEDAKLAYWEHEVFEEKSSASD